MKLPLALSCLVICMVFDGCNNIQIDENQNEIYLGGDLSYVNEMEDCGGVYRENGEERDPFELFSRRGADIVRVRLWNNPDWSGYSDYSDVYKTIQRTRETGMNVLLDFHYSDTWADPSKQIIPKAWSHIKDTELLGDSLYQFTHRTLEKLAQDDLLPRFVQIGNEINSEILQPEDSMVTDTIDWQRNLFLLQKGIQAVKDVSRVYKAPIETMIHIAQPENALWWFSKAHKYGLAGYEWIGLSYYPKWSNVSMDRLGNALDSLITTYHKKLMIVETAYPYIIANADSANNILWTDSLIPDYPASPEGQFNYLKDLTGIVIESGGQGVIYWEPAWISTSCNTPWGQGSHWDNATFFDAQNNNETLPAFNFFNKENYLQD